MVIILTSTSVTLLRERLTALKQAFIKKAGSRAEIQQKEVDRDTTFADVRGLLRSSSLFATKQLVILRNVAREMRVAEATELASFLGSQLPADTTVVLTETTAIAHTHPLARVARVRNMTVAIPSGAQAVQDLQTRIAAFDLVIQPQAAQELINRTRDDYDRRVTELEKLALFAQAQGHQELTRQEVGEAVSQRLESDIFASIEAFARRDAKTALTLLHRHLEQGVHPLYLLTMLRYQVRTLIQVATDPTQVSRFVAGKARRLLGHFSVAELQRVFTKLVDADEAIKTSQVDGATALDLLAVAIGSPAKASRH